MNLLCLLKYIFFLPISKRKIFVDKILKDKQTVLLITFFLVWISISSILGVDQSKSFFGNYYRADGLITYIHFFLLIFITKSVILLIPNTINYICQTIISSATLAATAAIFIYLLINVFKQSAFDIWGGPIGGIFGNPNFLGGFLVCSLPFVIFSEIRKAYKLFLASLIILGILITQSIGAVLSIIFLFVIYFIHTKKYVLAFAITIFALLATFYFFKQHQVDIYDNLARDSRVRIVYKGYLAFLEKPVAGYGLSNFDYAFKSIDWPIRVNHDIYVDKAHSNFLEILVTTGAIGFIIYISLVIRAFLNLKQQLATNNRLLPFFFSFVIFLFHSQTNIISISEEILFWLYIGVFSANKS